MYNIRCKLNVIPVLDRFVYMNVAWVRVACVRRMRHIHRKIFQSSFNWFKKQAGAIQYTPIQIHTTATVLNSLILFKLCCVFSNHCSWLWIGVSVYAVCYIFNWKQFNGNRHNVVNAGDNKVLKTSCFNFHQHSIDLMHSTGYVCIMTTPINCTSTRFT